jgi:ATP-dependent Zn protease
MQEFITASKFSNEEQFNDLLQILEKNSIPYQTEVFRERIDAATIRPLPAEYNVKVLSNNFAQVHEILNEIASKEVFEVDSSHYLFDFSDQELFDILAKPDEWFAFDYQLSQRILKERGKQIDKEFLNSLRKTRIEDLAKPEEKQTNNVWVGYLFALLGGLVGIAIGWNMMSSKKKLPNGEEIFSYQENDRKHGKRIVILGIAMFIIITVLKIVDNAYK